MSTLPDSPKREVPQEDLAAAVPSPDEMAQPETLALGVSTAPAEDAGLGALEPAFDQSAGFETFDDAGMQAFEPVTTNEEFESQPASQAEIAMPPQEAMRGAPIFSPAAFEEPSPDAGLSHPDAPTRPEKVPASPEMISLFITDERMNGLWDHIDHVEKEVPVKIPNLYLARELLNDIESARNALLSGRENYEEAKRFVDEAAYRLAFVDRLQYWSSTWGNILFVYETLWGLLFVWGMLRLGESAFEPGVAIFVYILSSIIWGGIGGITGALLSLIKHITKYQDFDIQYRMWYLGSPVIGAVVGLFIYGVIQVGLFSMTDGNIVSPFIVYILAWLGGYQQNVLTDIVKRLLKTFEISSSEKDGQK